MSSNNNNKTTAEFVYVDVWHSDDDGKAKAWKRIKVEEVPKYQMEEAKNYNCFASVQRFNLPIKAKGTAEVHIVPLLFDIDSKNVEESLLDTRKLLDFFTKELDLQQEDIEVFYSGSKGFHILVNEKAVGIEPRTDNHKIQKHLASYLIHRLDTKTIDLAVYTLPRVIRLPNSVHAKTKAYKIPLTLEEVYNLSIDDIKALASKPRDYTRKDLSTPKRKATEFYQAKVQDFAEIQMMASKRYTQDDYKFEKDKHPACVQDLLNTGWKRSDGRNATTVQLACYFKAAGYTQAETGVILIDWVKQHTSAKSQYQIDQRIANTKSVVSSIFAKDNTYTFSCAFIRSLHGEKAPGQKDYERVACSGDMCHCLTSTTEEEQEAVELTLEQTGNAEFTGKLIKTRVMVVGIKSTPYIVPKSIEYHCWGSTGCKKYSCPLRDIPSHIGYKNLSSYSRELLQMTAVSDEQVKGILGSISGIPSCGKFNTEISEQANVIECAVIPMAEDGDSNYVLRRVFLIRDKNAEVKVSENKYYEITGYVYPHPKNQECTIMVKDAKPLQDMVESFVLKDEIKTQLEIFQCQPTYDAIAEKINDICKELTYNVTHIVDRDEPLLGVMLVQHSILRFNVPWDSLPIRGWLELMVLGDTGTGKSALIDKLMKFTGLGDVINAESTSRTGLSYKMEQAGSGGAWFIVWGAFPRADKGFLWIDEATGISKEEYGQLTMARSDGKLQVKKAVTSETNCRVRAVMSGNVAKGKRIDDYTYGAKALREIFNNEDIRRFDFAVGLKASDVAFESYNRVLGKMPTTITGEAYRNNMLFAWSRTAEQVIILPETVDIILTKTSELSKAYGNVTDIPLVSPSDMRAKLARLSTALASLLHSVDGTGEKIVVYPAHVEYIYEYLNCLYTSKGLGLSRYARVSQGDGDITIKIFDRITEELKKIPSFKSETVFNDFLRLLSREDYFKINDIEAMLSIDKEEAKSIVNLLSKLCLVRNSTGGLRKESMLNSYIGMAFDKGWIKNNVFEL